MLLCERSIDCDPNQILTGGIKLTLAGGAVTGCDFTIGRLLFEGSCEDAAQKLLKESPQKQSGEIVQSSEKRQKSGQAVAILGQLPIRISKMPARAA